ncbi:uncharacterized protein LOC116211393 isoform X2 [Punica granatum]|uniref:Uncharacterized protein LOC116211393 isoform X2 n=1 Tax=Punica granatum TaxID=22663 RepID=A0A6P8E8H4_PUNGR|nr:uncharacterized protein LOC116211393 isoform X2 [Punica granatum]
MGRKPLASKAEERAPPTDGGNLPPTGEILGVKTTELVPESPERLPENGNAASDGMKPPLETLNPSEVIAGSRPKRKPKSPTDASKAIAKKPKVATPRRSGRLQSAVVPARNKDLAPISQDLTAQAVEEEVLPRAPEETRLPELSIREKNLEEKVISLSEAVEELKTCIEVLKLKMEEAWGRTPGVGTSTNGLHEECQKKIEALMNENRELTGKLGNAHMMYSKGNCLFSELMEKVKDIMLLFGLKAAEMAPPAPNATDSTRGRGLVDGMN